MTQMLPALVEADYTAEAQLQEAIDNAHQQSTQIVDECLPDKPWHAPLIMQQPSWACSISLCLLFGAATRLRSQANWRVFTLSMISFLPRKYLEICFPTMPRLSETPRRLAGPPQKIAYDITFLWVWRNSLM